MRSLLFRIYALRVNGPIALLLITLQRTPVLQAILRTDPRLPSMSAGIFSTVLLAVAGEASVHTLTGATRFTSNPASPCDATVGTSFSLVFAVTGAPSTPKSYKITGTLPPGLTVPGMNSSGILNASSGSITGIPTTAGSYTTYIQAYELANASGNTNKVQYPVTINVAGGAAIAPSITTQPQSVTITAGQSANFSVTATGTPDPTYQWKKGGVDIAGATSTTLAISNAQSSDAATYTVVVSNSAGSVTSNGATLTVNAATVAPAITTQPQSATVTAGQSASFSVAATGTPSPSYEWRKDGANIAGATGTTLSLSNVQSSDAATYTVVVSNSAGSVTSNGATLTVNPATVAPTITSQPQSLTVVAGQNATFTVGATGTPSPSYQWRKNGANIGGATSASFSVSNVQSSSEGDYSVVVSNSAGSVTSSSAHLTVNPAPAAPTITSQPQSVTVTEGQPATFTVATDGTPTPSYQWKKDGTAIPGATSTTFSIASAQTSDAGLYSVVVSNSAATIASNSATLTVNPAPAMPTITAQPQSLMLPVGYPATFTVTATGDASLAYQWSKDGVAIPGATSASFSIAAVSLADTGAYSVSVTTNAGTANSDAARLDVGTDEARLVNLSCRGDVQSGDKILIPGMYFTGNTTKRVLIRAIGPTLADPPFNVPGAMNDPYLRVYGSNGRELYSNDNWGGNDDDAETLSALFQQVGAFPLPPGSKDAAIVADIPPGQGITYHVSGADGGTGIAIVEVYELDTSGRITNISTRGYVGSNASLIIPGAAIVGTMPKTILIRAVGPSLGVSPFNIQGVLEDPVLHVMDSSGHEIMTNDNWGDAPDPEALRHIMQRVGAFPLVEGSKDAALVAVLPPGAHTFHVTGRNGGTGIALVEVYEIPDNP